MNIQDAERIILLEQQVAAIIQVLKDNNLLGDEDTPKPTKHKTAH